MAEQQQWFASNPAVEKYRPFAGLRHRSLCWSLGKARELTRRAVDSAIRADSKETGAIWWENAALREAAFGNFAEARQAAAAGLEAISRQPGVAG